MRGAKQGLSGVQWTFTASEDLTELREAMRLAAPQRQRRVREVALRLHLEHLATFCEDVAATTHSGLPKDGSPKAEGKGQKQKKARRRNRVESRENRFLPFASAFRLPALSPAGSDILGAVKLGDLAAALGCQLEGDAGIDIARVAAIEAAGAGDITFLANPKYTSDRSRTRASAVHCRRRAWTARRARFSVPAIPI